MLRIKKTIRFRSLALVTLMALAAFLTAACSEPAPAHENIVEAEGGAVSIPLDEAADGKVHFYTYRDGGKNINFFVRTDGQGALHTNFDACFTCYKAKKGYGVDEPVLYCRECNTEFDLSKAVWEDKGGCAPVKLPHSREADRLVIKTSDLEKGERLF